MSNLLEEALLDIEQLKKAVEEDAKNKLVESLTPKIRKFINSKLYENVLLEKREEKEVLVDRFESSENDESISYEEDPETGDEVAVLDLDELKTKNDKEQILDLDDDVEVEVDLNEFKKMIMKFKGERKMKLKDLFLKEESEKCEGCEEDDNVVSEMADEEEIIEIDENELKEALKEMKAKRKLNEDEIVLDIDVDEEGEIEDVEVVSVGDVEVGEEGDELDMEMDEEGEESEFELDMEMDEEGGELPEEELEGEELPEEEEEEEVMSVAEAKLRKKIRAMIREAYKNKKAKKKKIKEDVSIEVGGDVKVDIDTDTAGEPEIEVVEPEFEMETEEEDEMIEPLGMEENKKLKGSVSKLKKKLVETNLMNAKLVYANKLLMNNSITKKERVAVIESLDKAKSLREVELVYKTLVNKSNKKTERVTEGRRVLAGGSSATSTAKKNGGQTENADVEVLRWQQLAGV